HPITAFYLGDTNYNPSTSNTVNLVVNPPGKTNTSTSVSAAPNPANIGQSVTITATVSPSGGTGSPTGTVTFTDNGSALPSATLVGTTATITTSFTTAGSHSIVATYSGDGSFNGSTSTAVTLTVNVVKANTSLALTSSLNPSNFGDSVT